MGRAQAVELLRSWFASSPRAPLAHPSGQQPPVVLGQQSPGDPTPEEGEAASPAQRAERAWQDDAAFLQWVEGGSGAARVALELKALRGAAAARVVAELSSTAEGTEGLVRGLQAAVGANPALLLQLRSLLK